VNRLDALSSRAGSDIMKRNNNNKPKLKQKNNYYVGYDYPETEVSKGAIYLNQYLLGYFWFNTEKANPQFAQYSFNRCPLAIELGVPVDNRPDFFSPKEIVSWLERIINK